ncbi:hypothetical protein ANABIO32_12170 [Rossellomorea marisflavi]|nr:hypothetical protein ANABIO32_12170 [Rossellomorea marisflavi]
MPTMIPRAIPRMMRGNNPSLFIFLSSLSVQMFMLDGLYNDKEDSLIGFLIGGMLSVFR